jgi:hypothetical protein
MREHKKIKIETEELTKVLCDTCKKEIHKCVSGKAYIPPEAITVSRNDSFMFWNRNIFDFCSLECFLEWAKGESGSFNVSFPRDTLNNLASEYARLKSRDSRLNDTEIKSEDETIKRADELVKELKASIATAVKNAKIFINDIQDWGDYDFACGIVSALKFIVDEETHTELEELLEKQKVIGEFIWEE